MERRQFLATAASGSLSMAVGCLGSGRQRTEQQATVACDESITRTSDARATGDEDWPTVQYSAHRRGYVPGRLGPQGCPSVRWIWEHDEDISGPGMYTSALVADDTVYIADESPPTREGGDDDNTLIAIDAATGTERWRFEGEGKPELTPTIADGIIYVPGDNQIQAIDLDKRELRWRTRFVDGHEYDGDTEWAEVPAVVDGTVYSGTHIGTLYALDVESGEIQWTFSARGLPAEKLAPREPDAVADSRRAGKFDGPVAVADGIVYAANWDSNVYAIDAATGQELWSQFLYHPDNWSSRPSPPAVHDGTVYVSTRESGGVIAFDAETGEQEWVFDELPYGEGVAPAVADTTVYGCVGTSSENMYLVALDRSTGELLWKTWIGLPNRAPIVDDHAVYIDQQRTMLACDRETGSELWWFRKHRGSFASPSLANQSIYMADVGGHVYALW